MVKIVARAPSVETVQVAEAFVWDEDDTVFRISNGSRGEQNNDWGTAMVMDGNAGLDRLATATWERGEDSKIK